MKKKLFLSLTAVLIAITAAVSMAFAKGTIKIVVNGEQIKSDVTPQMSNNRVMVPISFVSKALGADVSWDQKDQTVSIKSKVDSQEDVWNQNLNIDGRTWAGIQNLITTFVAGFDNRDAELIQSITVEGFDMIPIGGIYPAIIDYDIVDAQISKDNTVKVRIKVIYQEEKLFGENWDIEIARGKIQTMRPQGRFDVNDYTVFSGLTIKNH